MKWHCFQCEVMCSCCWCGWWWFQMTVRWQSSNDGWWRLRLKCHVYFRRWKSFSRKLEPRQPTLQIWWSFLLILSSELNIEVILFIYLSCPQLHTSNRIWLIIKYTVFVQQPLAIKVEHWHIHRISFTKLKKRQNKTITSTENTENHINQTFSPIV